MTPDQIEDLRSRLRGMGRPQRRGTVAEWKREQGCMDCGLTGAPAEVYDLDHLPEFEKYKNVSQMMYAGLDRLVAEIAKCEVVCANCHRVRTAGRVVK